MLANLTREITATHCMSYEHLNTIGFFFRPGMNDCRRSSKNCSSTTDNGG